MTCAWTLEKFEDYKDQDIPDGRNGHAAVLVGSKMYVIGGWVGKVIIIPRFARKVIVYDSSSLSLTGCKQSAVCLRPIYSPMEEASSKRCRHRYILEQETSPGTSNYFLLPRSLQYAYR